MTAKERDELRVLTEAWSSQVAVIVRDERARIRRELLEAIDDLRVKAGDVKGDELRLWIVPSHLVAALDRICPEEET